MKATIITHFEDIDSDCDGDYFSVDVLIDDELVIEYGDWYHDNGAEKAGAFIKGIEYALRTKLEIKYINIADGKI